jgi:UDP-3-O-[3-hydroxymyristoyl] glucosamine N-acyltransferase
MLLGELAQFIQAELVGEPNLVIRRAWTFDSAEEGDVTLASLPAYLSRIKECRASAVIVGSRTDVDSLSLLISRNPKLAFARAIQALNPQPYKPTGISDDLRLGKGTSIGAEVSIHPRVTIGENSRIGNRVTLHPGVVIGDGCSVGDDSVIYANVCVYREVTIGSRVVIHSGTVIGADGFGFVPDEQGHQVKLPQVGSVIIEDDCEIGANCAIDRGGFGDTVLRRGVKLDNLIQVGHNTVIGEDTVVAALTGFSGGTIVGRQCVIGGQVGTREHVLIGDRVKVAGQSGVTRDVKAGAVIGGIIPAQDYNVWRRNQVLYSRLPEIAKRLKRLEEKVQKRPDDDILEPLD